MSREEPHMTTTVTIADRVREMHAGMADQLPNEVMGAFTREQTALAAAGAPSGIVAVGSTVPNVELLDANGATTVWVPKTSSTLVDPGPAGRLEKLWDDLRSCACAFCSFSSPGYSRGFD
jgi:hypothetical protein